MVGHGGLLTLRAPSASLLGQPGRRPGVPRRSLRARSSRLWLAPIGDGSTEHLSEDAAYEVLLPGDLNLPEGLYELGRAPPAKLIIPVPTVSSRHAIIRVAENGRCTVTDLNSTNGTYLDGARLQPLTAAELAPGSEVVFGDASLAKFRLEARISGGSGSGGSGSAAVAAGALPGREAA